MTFSRDGKRLAYAAETYSGSSPWVVVVDGKVGKKYFEIKRNSITFSSDSRHFAFVATRTFTGEFVVLDAQVETKPHGKIIASRREQGRLEYLAHVGTLRHSIWQLIVDKW